MSYGIEQRPTNLSEEQDKIVNWTDGAALVLGGPGTGKTNVLICRAVHLLTGQDGSDARVLGLTFTNKAADEMRRRISRQVPKYQDLCTIRTYHGLCADILREFGHHVGVPENFIISSNIEQLERAWNAALSAGDRGHSKSINRPPENLSFKSALDAEHVISFDDLIAISIKLLTDHPDVESTYRDRYRYWIIDEFQDTTGKQFALLDCLLGNRHQGVMFGGDDDQNIFEWNGSSISFMSDFARKLKAKVFYLSVNHRSGSDTIIRAASILVSHNSRRFRIAQRTRAEQQYRAATGRYLSHDLRCIRFHGQAEEYSWIAEDIAQYDTRDRSRIAVLSRRTKTVVAIAEELKRRNIDVHLYEPSDSFKTPEFRWLLAVLQLATDPMSKLNLAVVICEFVAICSIGVSMADIIMLAKHKQCTYLAAWCELTASKLTPSWALTLVNLVLQLNSPENDVLDIVETLFKTLENAQNMSQYTGNPTQMDRLNYDIMAWRNLNNQIVGSNARDIDLTGFIHKVQIRSKRPNYRQSAVHLSTVHSAKGMEFDIVYLADFSQGSLPDFRSKTPVLLEQERRICFVAMTRARKSVIMTYSEFEGNWSRQPSVFATEMGIDIESPKHIVVPITRIGGDQISDTSSMSVANEFNIEDYDEELRPLVDALRRTGKFTIEAGADVEEDGKVEGHYEAKIVCGDQSVYLVDEDLDQADRICTMLSDSQSFTIGIRFDAPPTAEDVIRSFSRKNPDRL